MNREKKFTFSVYTNYSESHLDNIEILHKYPKEICKKMVKPKKKTGKKKLFALVVLWMKEKIYLRYWKNKKINKFQSWMKPRR